MDAGGSDKDPIDGIREKGIRYPIRIRMNRSDEKMIYEQTRGYNTSEGDGTHSPQVRILRQDELSILLRGQVHAGSGSGRPQGGQDGPATDGSEGYDEGTENRETDEDQAQSVLPM